MTYQEWIEEMNKSRGRELGERKRLIENAAAKCSEKTREALDPFLNDLNDLFAGQEPDFDNMMDLLVEGDDRAPLSEGEYGVAQISLASHFASLMSGYEPPAEFLQQQGVANALGYIFDAFEVLDMKFEAPDFKKSDKRDAAARNDMQTYAAHALSMKDVKGEAPLREYLGAAVSMVRWRQDPGFKEAMKDTMLRQRLMQDEDTYFFLRDIQYSIREYEKKNAKTFKELSEDLAKDYRSGKIKYAQLELSMNALRALAKQKTNSEDRNTYDHEKITASEFREMVSGLRAAERRGQKTSEEFQAELADSNVMVQDRIAERVHDIYDATPVFNEDFDNPDAMDDSYRKQDFEKHMRRIDISGFSFSGGALSNEEFGSLSFLSVLDPKLAGSILSINGKSVKIDNGNLDIAASMLLHCTIAFGDATKEVNGQTIYGPEMRVGRAMETCVAPARAKAASALEAWKNGNEAELGKLIADGVNIFVNDIRHGEIHDGTINKHLAVHANMAKGTLDLLKRSPALMQAAADAGLKPETVQEMEGIIMANRIEKAGQEAKRRIQQSAQGLLVMNSFEKEQCILAAQRYDAMINDITNAENAWRESAGYNALSKEIDELEEKLFVKYGNDYKKNPAVTEEKFRLQYKYIHEQTKLLKRPGVYMTLGRDGVKGLDRMIPEGSLERAKAKSFVELAQDLGVTEKREIKTTAKQVYDQLTKAYKAHQLKYDQYAARLRTMRELTGDNKDAKIDIKAIDDAIEAKLNRSLGPVEEEIHKITKNEYGGVLGRRIDTVYKTYGFKPVPDERSLKNGKYTQEQFDQLEEISGDHFKLGGKSLDSNEFAALSIAATQSDPNIGAICWVARTEKGSTIYKNGKPVYDNVVTEPTPELAAAFRTTYTYDLDQGKNGARQNIGVCFDSTVNPARRNVSEAMLYYTHRNDPASIGKIIGLGIHNIVPNTYLADTNATGFNEGSVVEGNVLGKLASLAEADPEVKKVVLKYTTQDELDMAKGMGIVYEIARGAEEARAKLEASYSGEKNLTDTERKACIELMLRGKVMSDIAQKRAMDRHTTELTDKFAAEFNAKNTDTRESMIILPSYLGIRMAQNIGLPEYVKGLGLKGPMYARDLLDEYMPNREAFMELDDKTILDAMKTKPGAEKNPFMNEEYKKHTKSSDERDLDRVIREHREKQAAPQKTI